MITFQFGWLLLAATLIAALSFSLICVSWFTARDLMLKENADSRVAALIQQLLGVHTRGA